MNDRKKLGDRIRFEVFKRDRFTCQYCGCKAPDVVLNVDHIQPIADGGTDDLMNLVTSCRDCNSGKSDRRLSDQSAVEKARLQAESIEERRQQVEMMATWQLELARMSPEIEAVNAIMDQAAKLRLTDSGERGARSLIRKYGLEAVLQSIAISFDQYDKQSAWGRVPGILANRRLEQEDPIRAHIARVVHSVGRRFDAAPYAKRQAIDALVQADRIGLNWLEVSRAAESSAGIWHGYLNAIKRAIDEELL